MDETKDITTEVVVEKKRKKSKPVPTKGIGKFAMNLMTTTEKSNNQILEAVKKHFPKAQTTYECIAWYRSKLRREGQIE